MTSSWQQVFERLEAAGAKFSDLKSGRAFALDALRQIPRPLPAVLADAERIAETLHNDTASAEEIARFRERCWKYESTISIPGVPPHKNSVIAALRVAIGATDSSVEPEPWFWVSNEAMLAEAAGVPSGMIGRLLEKHYAVPT
ncbi:MAG TPA: hypothetical protein VJT80_12880 [Steroidobacteraceae bacterium]|nr:hypothetical protein [Steroidobacteraceae bacterium]